jgi:hypothetical protein
MAVVLAVSVEVARADINYPHPSNMVVKIFVTVTFATCLQVAVHNPFLSS